MRKLNILVTFLTFMLFSACGFKVIDQNLLKNFYIEEITLKGDKKINYTIKNKLNTEATNFKENRQPVTVTINSKIEKTIKEKNIKNKITKYNVKIIVDVDYTVLKKKISKKFSIIKEGDYDVANKYSKTLTNEKNLIRTLSKDIPDKIINNLFINIDEL